MAKDQFVSAAARARKAARLSQMQAAELIGVTDRMLCHYECGNTQVPPDVATRMADAYREPGLRTLFCQTVCPIGMLHPQIDPEMGVADSLLEAFLYDAEYVEHAMRDIHTIMQDGAVSAQETAAYEECRRTLREREAQLRQLLLSTERAYARSARR